MARGPIIPKPESEPMVTAKFAYELAAALKAEIADLKKEIKKLKNEKDKNSINSHRE